MRHNTVRRRSAALLALLVAISGLTLAVAGPAAAAPGDSGDDGEGAPRTLIQQLEAASRGYVEAKEALARSRTRQSQLAARLKELEGQVGPKQAAIDDIIQQSYRTGRLGPMSALLQASSSGDFLDRAQTLETVAVKENAALAALKATRDGQQRAKLAIDAEVRNQLKQVNLMAKRKVQAEAALKAANTGEDADPPGGGTSGGSSGGSSGGGSQAKATPAPRSSDGSLRDEGCTEDDPTTSGCLTPRTLHALKQAQKAGFTRYVACFREQNSGEHPKGQACDFAAEKKGFGGVASGGDKTYGTNLANYFINNSDRLGVLYVIWFKRIWLPSSGWKAYSRGNGDPSSDHTNHVHLSVR
ncbi:coiled-coil domain-containing protein [Actinoplanes sp. URMC 104]|uniref:coiled-coil domain-containing protein n=1 Tax=Actinoplanes sp. URMC 104 TaxID=3423409 RepID=UPI003F199709